MPDQPEEPPLRYWIKNRGLLRDEGVLFGLSEKSDAALEAKLDTIRHAFGERIAWRKSQRKQRAKTRETLAARRDALQERINTHEDALSETEEDGGGALSRHVLGAAFAAGMCGFNYFLIYEHIAGAFDHPHLVALGVLLAGLFSFLQPVSLLYTSDEALRQQRTDAELWKLRLVEFGMPLTTAFFVVVWRFEETSLLLTGANFAFIFMLFLFGGKLLLSSLPKLSQAVENLRGRRRTRRERQRKQEELDVLRNETLPAATNALREAEHHLREAPSVSDVEAARDTALALFQSEYRLAREALASGLASSEYLRRRSSTNAHVEDSDELDQREGHVDDSSSERDGDPVAAGDAPALEVTASGDVSRDPGDPSA